MTTNLSAAIAQIRGHLKSATFRTIYGPFKLLHARNFIVGVALQVLAVMALVEAIFLAERFPMVFRDVLKNNASLFDTSLIFACNSTQIFDLALAIAILFAVYTSTLRMRENRELLVLFAAGTGPYQLTGLILMIAFIAQVGSLIVSGVIDPASRYAVRVILFDAEFRALRDGINTGQFYYFPNRVAFAPAQPAADRYRAGSSQSKKLFVFEQVKPDMFRAITADRARLYGPDAYGMILLKLAGFTAHTFSNAPATARPPIQIDAKACAGCPSPPKGVRRMTLSARDVTQEMTVDELLTFQPRGSDVGEWTIFDQFAPKADTTVAKRRDELRLLGERFARSLLCLLAPLIALAAVCLTSRAFNYLVLPLACMALMSLNVTSEWLIRTIAPSDPLGALTVPAALAAVFVALLLVAIARNQGDLVRPQLARP